LCFVQAVTPSILQGLMELIRNEMQNSDNSNHTVESFYNSTLSHIQHQKAQVDSRTLNPKP
jgi:hypothetical protein